MQMPFGKYRGEELQDIPRDYLRWLLHNVELRGPALKAEVEYIVGEEAPEDFPDAGPWTRRATGSTGGRTTPPTDLQAMRTDLVDAVESWQRRLARQFHPDRGGTDELMKAINEGAAMLRAAIDETIKRRA